MRKNFPMKHLSVLAIAATLLFASCDPKKNTPAPVETGNANIELANKVGTENLALNTGNYTNAHGDNFKVSMYKYYISNIELINENGSSYKEDYSYHLIDESVSTSKAFTLKNIPTGTYTKMKVVLGVDSTHNVSGAQTGDLDPSLGMFWEWSTGYIMAKIEGTSPQSGNAQGIISFHLGGFSGMYSSVKVVTYDLPQPLKVTTGTTPKINLESDLLKWFTGGTLIDFQSFHAVTSVGRDSYQISENYKYHLSVKSVQN